MPVGLPYMRSCMYYSPNPPGRDGIMTGTPDTADYYDCFFFSVQTMDAIGMYKPFTRTLLT